MLVPCRECSFEVYKSVRNRCGPVLMSNHAINVQRKRLYEQKAWLRPVVNAQSLPHAKFNWELLIPFGRLDDDTPGLAQRLAHFGNRPAHPR